MKVLFLDVDGVLCTRRSHLAYGREGGKWFFWDPLGCDVIHRVLQQGVKVVATTTWREPRSLDELVHQLVKHGLSEMMVGDWKTPCLYSGYRGDEVADWLKRHPETESYRALDDAALFHDEQEKYVIRTDPDEGMTSANIKELFNWRKGA